MFCEQKQLYHTRSFPRRIATNSREKTDCTECNKFTGREKYLDYHQLSNHRANLCKAKRNTGRFNNAVLYRGKVCTELRAGRRPSRVYTDVDPEAASHQTISHTKNIANTGISLFRLSPGFVLFYLMLG